MPDKFTFNVLHPNGSVVQREYPLTAPLADVHADLSSLYHPDDPLSKASQPTAEGAIENSESFQSQANAAWNAVNRGLNNSAESGFSVDRKGRTGPLKTKITPPGKIPQDDISFNPDDLGVFHTHPDSTSRAPSQNDITAAKQIRKTIWVGSSNGLYSIDPGGKVTQVFNKADWMKSKKK